MAALAAITALTLIASPGAYLAADTAAAGGDSGLYPAVAAVVVALIGGAVAIVTSRRREDSPSVRYVDPPSSNALPAAMSELAVDLFEENKTLRIERDLWRRRAVQAGWDE